MSNGWDSCSILVCILHRLVYFDSRERERERERELERERERKLFLLCWGDNVPACTRTTVQHNSAGESWVWLERLTLPWPKGGALQQWRVSYKDQIFRRVIVKRQQSISFKKSTQVPFSSAVLAANQKTRARKNLRELRNAAPSSAWLTMTQLTETLSPIQTVSKGFLLLSIKASWIFSGSWATRHWVRIHVETDLWKKTVNMSVPDRFWAMR